MGIPILSTFRSGKTFQKSEEPQKTLPGSGVENDNIGRLSLLTPTRVKAAASEIKTGEMIRLDLPLDVPKQPAFGREVFQHSIKALAEGIAYDDIYHMNTQSGTQWDGFRHVAHMPTQTFYNGCKSH